MSYLALDPVSVAIYTVLNVSALTDLVPGGVMDDVAQSAPFPRIWFEVQERDVRGFGEGGLPEVQLRVHTFTRYGGTDGVSGGVVQAQAIARQVIALLRDATLTVTGYKQCGKVFYDETSAPIDADLNGVKVHEIVSHFRTYVEDGVAEVDAPSWVQESFVQ